MSEVGAVSALSWLSQLHHSPADAHEAVALAVHALILNHGFRPAELPPADAAAPAPAVLPSGWGGAGFGGRYRHARSAMTFDIRAVPMGGRLVVHATALEEDSRLYTLDVRVVEYVADAATFPSPPADAPAPATDWEATLARLPDLATLVQVQLAHRLVPDAAKDGYEATPPEHTTQSAASSASAPPRAPPPRRPLIDPLLDRRDPLQVGEPHYPRYPGYPAHPGTVGDPGGFGADDLFAPGLPRDVFPGGGAPPPMGGNLMGPRNFPRPGMPVGGRRPRGIVPGARFDPYGPPVPDRDLDGHDVGQMPGFEDEHQLRSGPGRRGPGGGAPSGGGGSGLPDDGPPPGMYF